MRLFGLPSWATWAIILGGLWVLSRKSVAAATAKDVITMQHDPYAGMPIGRANRDVM